MKPEGVTDEVITTLKSLDIKEILSNFIDIVGADNVTREPCDLFCYSNDFSICSTETECLPDCVIQPKTTEQVSAIAELANRHQIPLVPRGGGTGMWGGVIPTQGGIVLDMRNMNRIIDINEEKCTATVQAGVLVRDLANQLKKRGFFVADKPESWFAATVGARTQGSGTGFCYNAKYGRSIDQVLSLEVVLPDGQIIRTGSPHVSDPAFGYDLTRLFSNAEGTLGIITEVTFRMYRLPEHQIITMYKFPNFTETINAVIAIRDSGLVPETLETMDGMSYCIYAKEARAKETSENIGAMVIGNAGAEKLIRSQVELTQEICDRYKGTVTPDTCVERWKAFRETYPVNPFPLQSAAKKKPIKYVLDAVVPLASTAELVSVYHGLVEKYGVESREFSARHCAPDFQSVVYARAYVDERDKKNCAAVRKMEAELYCTIRKLGGGIGGAGGIGLTRLPYANNGEAPASDLGKKLKRLLDANNIMNPGKKFTF